MIWVSRHGQSMFWADAFKGALAMAVPCFAFDWMLLSPGGRGFLGVFFLLMVPLAPLVLFAAAALVMFLFRRPGWLLGPVFILLVNGAFLDALR